MGQSSDLITKAAQKTWHGVLPEGTRLDSFTIDSVLGQGGFGTTYLATDNLGRRVAIKEYLPDGLAIRDGESQVLPRSTECIDEFQRGREDFLKEAQILTQLENIPGIVGVYNYLEANGTAYMVMALAVGQPLKDIIKQRKEVVAEAPFLIYEEVRRVFFSLLDGLAAVHKRGFLHRDIKPANIIVDSAWNPTLIDFGASRAVLSQRTQRVMTSIYTPGYGSLEQMNSGRQGAWTDIYGLAATVYAIIVGSPPPDVLTRLDPEKGDTYRPLADMDLPDFPPEFLQAIDAGLILRSSDRPQSIAAWRQLILARSEEPDDRTIISRKSTRRSDPAVVTRAFEPDPTPDLEESTRQAPYPPSVRSTSARQQVPVDPPSGRAESRRSDSRRELSQPRSQPSAGPFDISLKNFLEEEEQRAVGPAPLAPPVAVPASSVKPRNNRLALVAGGVASVVLLAGGAYMLTGRSTPPPAISQAPDVGNAHKQAAAEQLAVERAALEKVAAENIAAEKAAAEKAAAVKAAADKAAAERAVAEKAAAEKAAADRATAERAAVEKAAAEKAAADRAIAERAAAEKAAAERAAADRAIAERARAEKAAAERAAAVRADAEKAASEKAAAEKAAADRAVAERAAAEKAAADKAAADRAIAERARAEKAAAERAAAVRADAERAAAEKAAAEKAAADRAVAERAAAEKAAAEKAAADRAVAERAAAEKAAREKVAAEKAASDKAEAERAVAEKAAAEKAAAAAKEAAAKEAAAKEAAAREAAAKEAAAKETAPAVDPKRAEAAELALRLSQQDRQHIQVALTSLNFNTQGTDGVFGPRSREMIANWQKAQNQPASGFLTDDQRLSLLAQAKAAITRFEEERKNAEAARLQRLREAERATPPAPQQSPVQPPPQQAPAVQAQPAPPVPPQAQQEPAPKPKLRMGPMFN